jgi:hypothetical protein
MYIQYVSLHIRLAAAIHCDLAKSFLLEILSDYDNSIGSHRPGLSGVEAVNVASVQM